MKFSIKNWISWGILAAFLGFFFVTGGYLAHDLFRTVDDQNVVWLVNRSAAAVVITLFIVLGFIMARAVEHFFLRWWKTRQNPPTGKN